MEGPALLCARVAGSTLGVHRVPNALQRGERIRYLSAALLIGRGLPHRVQPLGEIVRVPLDVVPACAVSLGERALPFRSAHGAVQGPPGRVGVFGSGPPACRRHGGAGGAAGRKENDAQQDEGTQDDPQPDEVRGEPAR